MSAVQEEREANLIKAEAGKVQRENSRKDQKSQNMLDAHGDDDIIF